jgi:crotonobetainyl-CoA:carnitine CoA-transferase CaiB-like acyl-CoA transferase
MPPRPSRPLTSSSPAAARKLLRGVRILSLALNLPGPAALMRCRSMGASCVKLEPPARPGAPVNSGDPMQLYAPQAYADLHEGVRVLTVDLKSTQGQTRLHRELAKTDVLLTSFRPSALQRLGLSWKKLHQQYPALSQVAIVGGPGTLAEVPGHDLTYLAEHDLINGLHLPPTLFADMSGALMASEAVLQAVLQQRSNGKGMYREVALSDAAAWLALPRTWGLTQPEGTVGGAHAGYRVYACQDGRVAVAALEPHFAAALCAATNIPFTNASDMLDDATHQALTRWLRRQSCAALQDLAHEKDLPLHVMPGRTAAMVKP